MEEPSRVSGDFSSTTERVNDAGWYAGYRDIPTKSNHSFSKRSMTISKVSHVTWFNCSFLRSELTAFNHSRSMEISGSRKLEETISNLAHPYHTQPEWLVHFPGVLMK
jgi:hypothetical protein